MAGVVNEKWSWDVTTLSSGSAESSVKVVAWDADTTTPIVNQSTDASGKIATQYMTEAIHSVTLTDTVSTDSKTPHVISCLKYGIVPFSININFTANRDDTFYLKSDPYIVADYTTVSGYTGISIDHVNQKITISGQHSLQELYDYCQYDIYNNPQKSFPTGILRTSDGLNYFCEYDIDISAYQLSGGSKNLQFASGKKITVLSTTSVEYITIVGDIVWNTAITATSVNVTGTWYFDSSVNITVTDCTVETVDTITGDETVVIIKYGSTSIATNNDPTNIEIRNPVPIKFTVKDSAGNPIPNARIYLKEVASGTVLVNNLTDSNGEWSDTYNYQGTDIDVTGRIRKATTAPYYRTYDLSGNITSGGYIVNAIMIEDV